MATSTPVVLGFTGTRRGSQSKQHKFLSTYLHTIWKTTDTVTIHHGDCIGWDTEFHKLCVSYDFNLIIHPPLNTRARAYNLDSGKPLVLMPVKPYIERNHDIVDACHELIACPHSMEEVQRSGTWATIRYAKNVGKDVFIIFPDGTTGHIKKG